MDLILDTSVQFARSRLVIVSCFSPSARRYWPMRSLFIVLLLASPTFAQGWKPQLAADYLDSRQEKWFVWPTAQSKDGPCVSCHTGLTYLLARPVLRTALGENQPTKFETGLIDRLRSNIGAKPPAALRDVEVIFAALFLARQDEGKKALS